MIETLLRADKTFQEGQDKFINEGNNVAIPFFEEAPRLGHRKATNSLVSIYGFLSKDERIDEAQRDHFRDRKNLMAQLNQFYVIRDRFLNDRANENELSFGFQGLADIVEKGGMDFSNILHQAKQFLEGFKSEELQAGGMLNQFGTKAVQERQFSADTYQKLDQILGNAMMIETKRRAVHQDHSVSKNQLTDI